MRWHDEDVYSLAGSPSMEVMIGEEKYMEWPAAVGTGLVGTAVSVLAGQGMGSSCPVAVVGSLFSISCTKDIVYTEGQDKTLMATSLSSSRLVFNLSCIAGFVYCFAINHIEPSTIAIGAGDGQIRVWRMGGRAMVSMTCIHAKMNQSKFMSLAWYHIGRG